MTRSGDNEVTVQFRYPMPSKRCGRCHHNSYRGRTSSRASQRSCSYIEDHALNMRVIHFVVSSLSLFDVVATKPVLPDPEQPVIHRNAFNFKRGLPSQINSKHLRPVLERRIGPSEQPFSSTGPDVTVEGYSEGAFAQGQPINEKTGKGATISGRSRSCP